MLLEISILIPATDYTVLLMKEINGHTSVLTVQICCLQTMTHYSLFPEKVLSLALMREFPGIRCFQRLSRRWFGIRNIQIYFSRERRSGLSIEARMAEGIGIYITRHYPHSESHN